MKDIILLLVQIIMIACILGFIGSLLNYFFGFTIGFKGAEIPPDLRATASFLIAGALCGAIVYFWGKSGSRADQNKPE